MYQSKIWSWSRRRVWKQMIRTMNTNVDISSKQIRQKFLDFFIRNYNHQYVHSSSVLPPKGQGTYFTNSGMNQFKPIFLGTVDSDSEMSQYRRVVNCQKCVRVGGKHNDLEDVGRDLTHHTFFEMLGNWSFADYFKTEACAMALKLLTEVYDLPRQNLYVTYFGGNSRLNLPADEECRQVWLSLGMPPARVLPFGMKDNFWDMGNTGPCGPCSEIHYDHVGNRDASSLVNSGSPDVVEIWNLVFMQFDRQADQSLVPLPSCHVDTGLGLERLCAVMRGSRSNYDTDLFAPLFDHIKQSARAPGYQGRTGTADSGGVDSAYRLVADHSRMVTVTVADGLLPGNEGLEHKLRHVLHRCIHQAHSVLHLPQGFLPSLVDVVVDTLGEAYPEITRDVNMIKEVINTTEERYLANLAQGRKTLEKFLNTQVTGTTRCLSGDQVLGLYEGKYGPPVAMEIITALAQEKGFTIDMTTVNRKLEEEREISYNAALLNKSTPRFHLDKLTLQQLRAMGVAETDDSGKYQYKKIGGAYDFTSSLPCLIGGLLYEGRFVDSVQTGKECRVVLDRTVFYSEGGGQVSDQGEITTQNGSLKVSDVQKFQGYVLHTVTVTSGEIHAGDHVRCQINQTHREGCMRNHTATHLLNFALRQVLGDHRIRQRGSLVTADKLTFDFSYFGTIDEAELEEVEAVVRRLVSERRNVTKTDMSLRDALNIPDLIKLENELYPSKVRIVSVDPLPGEVDGREVVELCGGTHVENTGDIGEFCVTRMTTVSLGTKRLTAVTGDSATQAIQNSCELDDVYRELEEGVLNNNNMKKWQDWEKELNKGLAADLVKKTTRDDLLRKLSRLGEKMSSTLNKTEKDNRINDFLTLLDEQKNSPFVILDMTSEITIKQMVKTIQTSFAAQRPTFIISRNKKGKNLSCLASVPQEQLNISSEELCESLVERFGGRRAPVKGKNSDGFHMVVLNPTENTENVMNFVKEQFTAVINSDKVFVAK